MIGGGSWGTALASLAAPNCSNVLLWMRNEDDVRTLNATRYNPRYAKDLRLRENIRAISDIKSVFGQHSPQAVIWALPSSVARPMARQFAPYFKGDEVVIHATKGVEEGTLKRMTEILREELPCPRVGVVSGPNLAGEIARGEPAGAVVASQFDEVVHAGEAILGGPSFRIYSGKDVIGIEWAGTLKNILAIASGSLDAMGLGWNARSMLIARGLAEMVRFGVAMGGQESTFLGLAGCGDLLATCASNLSRNYQVGYRLAKGEKIEQVLKSIGSVAEGVRTAKNVWEFARTRKIRMPITQAVYQMVKDEITPQEAIKFLMEHPLLA